jgi:glutamate-1-semialdehyde 2,1-aminomutase
MSTADPTIAATRPAGSLPRTRSEAAFEAAQWVMPGGVNSPVRAFRGVGGTPVFVDHAAGSRVWDIDGNSYLDYVLSWGPMILGHAHPAVVSAIIRAAERGSSFGAPTLAETELAGLVTELVPGAELVRLVSSGTEATMSALRLARAATGRTKIVKFAGCYHGHADLLLVQAGSGVATLGLPDSPGVPIGVTADTLVAPYNDLGAVEALMAELGDAVAAIIVEPVAANMGVVSPAPGFLEGLRRLTDAHGALLILDEVLTGFRVALGGAAERYGVTPDIVTLGKVLGGGLPLAAYAGRREVMETVAPAGPMYQGGTLSGNPVATAAGIATLRALREPGVFDAITAKAERLVAGMAEAATEAGVPLQTAHVGTLGGFFFTDRPVRDYTDAKTSDTERYGRFFHALLRRGVYVAPSQFEAAFLSAAHSDADLDATIEAIRGAMAEVA